MDSDQWVVIEELSLLTAAIADPVQLRGRGPAGGAGRVLVSESQLSHEIVNLLFTITDQDIKLTVLWGRCLSTTKQ